MKHPRCDSPYEEQALNLTQTVVRKYDVISLKSFNACENFFIINFAVRIGDIFVKEDDLKIYQVV